MAKEKRNALFNYELRLIVKESVGFLDVINASLGLYKDKKQPKLADKKKG
jgi:hypothetical protein